MQCTTELEVLKRKIALCLVGGGMFQIKLKTLTKLCKKQNILQNGYYSRIKRMQCYN
jgi:hypothetical protein